MANWKSKAVGKTVHSAPKNCLSSLRTAAGSMLPEHAEAQAALAREDFDRAIAIAQPFSETGEIWPQYVLSVADWFSGRPMRAVARTTRGLARPATSEEGRHYQRLLREVQASFTAGVPVLLAKKPRPTLSVCLIVKNEGLNLERCIKSFQKIADETVVIDTGSTDQTTVIAKRLGAKLGHFDWADDFAAARNAALDLASCEWVLSIDADERLLDVSHQAMKVSMADPTCMYQALIRGGSGGQTFSSPRLFPRVGARWKGELHESVRYESRDILSVPLSALVLLHEGREEEREHLIERAERNKRVLQVMREKGEETPGLADVYEALNASSVAPAAPETIRMLQAAAVICAPWRSGLSRQVVRKLSASLVETQRFEEAIEVADLAERHGLDGLWSKYLRARYAFMNGRMEEAKRYAEEGLLTADDEGPVERMRADLQAILKEAS